MNSKLNFGKCDPKMSRVQQTISHAVLKVNLKNISEKSVAESIQNHKRRENF